MRDVAVGDQAAQDIGDTTGTETLHVGQLDLADISSVDRFVEAWEGPLHVLVNNAGVMNTPEQYTPPGWELQFATDHMWATSRSASGFERHSPPTARRGSCP